MVFITEELVRKRAEHNELCIGTLEELSLHQLDIEKLENIDKWCKDLKILYLHNNIILKMENMGRLKMLEYVNFTLNCIEIIENLEGCEVLHKLDMTANFIGDLRCIKSLKANKHLRLVYLTGNPCVQYEHYRAYVIDELQQIDELDGQKISKTERLTAKQMRPKIQKSIHALSDKYNQKRREQKKQYFLQEKKTGDDFWNEVTEDSPEARFDMHIETAKQKEDNGGHKPMFEKPDYSRKVKFFAKDGTPLNVNESNLNFTIDEDRPAEVELRIKIPKFLDTELVDVDSQPKYLKLMVNGKGFQFVWTKEVKPDSGVAQRSQITGELKIVIPKLNPDKVYFPKKEKPKTPVKILSENSTVDYRNIIKDMEEAKLKVNCIKNKEEKFKRENDSSFVDDSDVPPLM